MLVIGRKNGHGGLHMLGYYILEDSLEFDLLEARGGFYFTLLYFLMIHLDSQIPRNHILPHKWWRYSYPTEFSCLYGSWTCPPVKCPTLNTKENQTHEVSSSFQVLQSSAHRWGPSTTLEMWPPEIISCRSYWIIKWFVGFSQCPSEYHYKSIHS